MNRTEASLEPLALVFALAFPTAAAWLYFITLADAAYMPAVYAACKAAQFAFPLLWVAVAGWPGRAVAGGAPRRPDRGAWAGLLTGFGAAAFLWIAYAALVSGTGPAREAAPRIAARIVAIGAAGPVRYLVMTLGLSVAHSFLEEYYWRWFVFGRLRMRWGGAAAGVVSSLAFAGHHVIVLHAFIGPGRWWWMTVVLSAAVAAGGGLWAWLYARTGSLLSPWLSHVLVDLAIFAIGWQVAGGIMR